MNPLAAVRSSTAWVVDQAEHVTINDAGKAGKEDLLEIVLLHQRETDKFFELQLVDSWYNPSSQGIGSQKDWSRNFLQRSNF